MCCVDQFFTETSISKNYEFARKNPQSSDDNNHSHTRAEVTQKHAKAWQNGGKKRVKERCNKWLPLFAVSSRCPLRLRDSAWFSSLPVSSSATILFRSLSSNVRRRRIITRANCRKRNTLCWEKEGGKLKVVNEVTATSSFSDLDPICAVDPLSIPAETYLHLKLWFFFFFYDKW